VKSEQVNKPHKNSKPHVQNNNSSWKQKTIPVADEFDKHVVLLM